MNLNNSSLNGAAATAERLVDTAAPRLRDTASSMLDAIKPVVRPVLAYALPLARRVNWRLVAFGLVAGAAGYLLRAGVGAAAERKARLKADQQPTKPPAKPPELNRWENEGGMIATSAPAATAASRP